MNKEAIKIKNNEGAAAASNRSSDAEIYAVVAKVSKLKGLKINVIGNSLIISKEIKIIMNKREFLKKGTWIFIKVFLLEKPRRYALSSTDILIFSYPDFIPLNAKE